MDGFIIAAWLGGLLMGWVVVLHFLVVGSGAGCSTAYACVVDKVHKDLNWFGRLDSFKFFFVIGLPLGGFIHAVVYQTGWDMSFDMGVYNEVLPVSLGLKLFVLFIGGSLLGFGARLAGGCTTGHALVGGAMLSWASMFAAVMFFVVATITTWLLFKL